MSQRYVKQELKKIDLEVHEVEQNAVIVNLNGWRKRVYFTDSGIKNIPHIGKVITVQYTGDIKDIHSVVFEPIK